MDYKLHQNSTTRSANPYVDNYVGFIWNGQHSSDYNCFIENTGHLTFEPAPEFSNSTVTPAFYDGAIYTGVQTQSKKIQLNLVFYQVTLQDFNKALKWLDRSIISSFLLDYDPNWRYQCKINSLGTVEKYVTDYCIDPVTLKKTDLYLCRVQVSFETVDIHNAISTYGRVVVTPTSSSTYLLDNSNNMIDVPFRVHLYNFTTRYIVINQLTDNGYKTICTVVLNLDGQQQASLHYDSRTGAVTMVGKLIQSLPVSNGELLSSYCMSTANVVIPAGDTIQLSFPDYNGEVEIEYDYQTNVI